MVAPTYFQVNHGKHEVPPAWPSTRPGRGAGQLPEPLQVLPDESPLLPFLGERTEEFFRQAFELKVNGDLIPVDHAQELLDEVVALFKRYNCEQRWKPSPASNPPRSFTPPGT